MSGKYFIGGLSRDTTSESLRAYFELYGELLDAVVMTKEGHSRGFGFVTFVNPTVVAPTFLQTTHVVDGKKVEVKSAIPQEEMTSPPYFYPQPISQPTIHSASAISYPQPSSQTNKLFVGGITPQTTKDMLEAHFSQFGTVVDAVVLIDMAGRPRGFGFVSYSTPEEADNAIRWGPHIIDSRLVDVKSAEPKGSPNLVSPNPIVSSYQNSSPERVGFPPNFPYYSSPTPVVSNPLQGSTENPHSIHSKVFVGGLNRDTTEDGLIAYFGQFGTLEGCEILRRDGISRGFAFVVFEDDFVASQVLASMPHIIDGKQVELKACVPKTVDPPQKRIVTGFPAGRGLS